LARQLGSGTVIVLFLLAVSACTPVAGGTGLGSGFPQPSLPVSPVPTGTPARTPSGARTRTLSPAASPTELPTATVSPTVLPAVLPTPTPTLQPTATLSPTETALPPPPTVTPSAIPTAGPTPDGNARSAHVPILMYHYISDPPAGADAVRRDLSVSPALFESHLRYLGDAGYHVVTLDDLLRYLTSGLPLPEKPVILTFDDGYVDNFVNAFPLLKGYGMVGQFFLITDFVDAGRADYMTWPQIELMSAAGQRFGSHSRNHPDLSGQSVDYLVWQALGGLEDIQQHLGYHPRWIAYPSGSYDNHTIQVYKSANYWGGLTTVQGATHTGDGIFELSRVRVRGSYSADDLARLLELNW
jgi:peptidoglycan/xylan/chitin deacetylase (PgdA/CDA1 family)